MATTKRSGPNLRWPDKEEIVFVEQDGWCVPVPAAMFDRLDANGYDWDAFVAACRAEDESQR